MVVRSRCAYVPNNDGNGYPFEAKSTYPQGAAGLLHSGSDGCDGICVHLRYLRFLRAMETVFIRSEIKNNNLQATNDVATKSNYHPGFETTLKKKSVQIRVHPCPIFFTRAQAGCTLHEVETPAGNDACDETKDSKPKTQPAAMKSASICVICGQPVRAMSW